MALKEVYSPSGPSVLIAETVTSNDEFYTLIGEANYCYFAVGLHEGEPFVRFGSQARHKNFLEVVAEEGEVVLYGQLTAFNKIDGYGRVFQRVVTNSHAEVADGIKPQLKSLYGVLFEKATSNFWEDTVDIYIGEKIMWRRYKNDQTIWENRRPEEDE